MKRRSNRARLAHAVSLADSLKAKSQSASSPEVARDLEDWRSGVRGRPTQLFIGFLPSSSKADAVSYAIGVAERNAVNPANCAYRVFPWRGGWAYEVHEGGAKRAYLPAVLRFFDDQSQEARLDDLVAHIKTTGRAVRIERTQTGLVAFVMPEDFEAPQSVWLEPGPRLKPALPPRIGLLLAGLVIFFSGCVAAVTALSPRAQPPPEIPQAQFRFEDLPISQWPAVLTAAAEGYVDALEYQDGQWKIRRAQAPQFGETP